jgi:hypothetical protein
MDSWSAYRVLAASALVLTSSAADDCAAGKELARDFMLLLIVALVIGAVFQVASLITLVVCIVKLARTTPSAGWGATALAMGLLVEMPTLIVLLNGATALQILHAYGLSLVYVGVRNLQLAKARVPPDV